MADQLFPERTEFDERVAQQPIPTSSVHDALWGENVPVSDTGWASFADAAPPAAVTTSAAGSSRQVAPPAGVPSLRAWTIRSDAEQRHIDRLMARMSRPHRMTARQMVAEATAAADAQAAENMRPNVLHERRSSTGIGRDATTARCGVQQQQRQQHPVTDVEMSDRRMLLAQAHRSDVLGGELEGNISSDGEDGTNGTAREPLGDVREVNAMRVSWRDICCCLQLCPTK